MTEAADADIAAAIRTAGRFVLVAGEELALESGIPRRPSTAAWMIYGPRMRAIYDSTPGPSHHAARRMQDHGWLRGVITLGDDVLFDEAGVRDVVALRGSVDLSVCPACRYTEPLGCLLELLPTPHCAACGAGLRPDVTLPGEPPTAVAAASARALLEDVGLVLIAGDASPRDALVGLDATSIGVLRLRSDGGLVTVAASLAGEDTGKEGFPLARRGRGQST